mgnify:CR=1 FL=1
MNQETNTIEFKVFHADLKKMSDAELEASLKELRAITADAKAQENKTFRRKAA